MNYENLEPYHCVALLKHLDRIMSDRLQDEVKELVIPDMSINRHMAMGYSLCAGFVLDLIRQTSTGHHYDEALRNEKNKERSTSTGAS